jgi:hypothetical protein
MPVVGEAAVIVMPTATRGKMASQVRMARTWIEHCSKAVPTIIVDNELARRNGTRPTRVLSSAYPFTAPDVMPATICRLKTMYNTSTGMVINKMSVKSRCHWLSAWLW